MGRGHEPTLMEVGERHHIAIGWRRHILLTKQQPLLGRGPHVEKTVMDKALHALQGNVRVAPQIHWKMGVGGWELDGGRDADAGSLSDWRW